MAFWQIIMAILVALVLFLFAIESFSKELEHTFKDRLAHLIERATRHPLLAFLTGASATGILQSSSAVSVLCVSLVSTGIMTFKQSVGVLIGINVGTTLTAQLVALKLTAVAPVFLIIGYLLNFTKGKIGMWGKPIFYFGLLFFGLNLLGQELGALKDLPFVESYLAQVTSPWVGLVAGAIITALLQSSSVVTGLLIVLAYQNVLTIPLVIAMIIGANVGTTITAIMAALPLGVNARRTALANFLINLFGLMLFIPLLYPFTILMQKTSSDVGQQVANAHLFFNLVTAMAIFPFQNILVNFVLKRVH